MSVLSFGACCCNVMSQLATLLDLTITSRMVRIIPSAHNPTISATAPSFPSPIRTVTAGSCRKSRSGWPVASTPRRRLLRRRTTWRVHFCAPRPRTASTRSASGRPTRTGQIGTPSTWCGSSLAKSCRYKRLGPSVRAAGALFAAVRPGQTGTPKSRFYGVINRPRGSEQHSPKPLNRNRITSTLGVT